MRDAVHPYVPDVFGTSYMQQGQIHFLFLAQITSNLTSHEMSHFGFLTCQACYNYGGPR